VRLGQRSLLMTIASMLAVIAFVGLDRPHAAATIHEGPVASWCSILASGNTTPLAPPGITPEDGKGPDANVARPLLASGMVALVPFDGGVLVDINEDHPAVHTLVVGDPIEVEEGFWLEPFVPDPDFPAFAHCPNLVSEFPE